MTVMFPSPLAFCRKPISLISTTEINMSSEESPTDAGISDKLLDHSYSLHQQDGYTALILTTKRNHNYVIGERHDSKIWKEPSSCPLPHTVCKIKGNLVPGVAMRLKNHIPKPISVYEIIRKECMVEGFNHILNCNETQKMMEQVNLRKNFEVPSNILSIIDFVKKKKQYRRLLKSCSAKLKSLAGDSVQSQKDMVFLACTSLKLLEDAFRKYPQMQKPNTSGLIELKNKIGKDEVSLVLHIDSEVECERDVMGEEENVSLTLMCLQWVISHYDHPDRDGYESFQDIPDSFMKTVYTIGWDVLKNGNNASTILDANLVTNTLQYEIPSVKRITGENTMFDVAIEEMERGNLFVLLEGTLMWQAKKITGESILSVFVILHEIEGSAYANVRGLNYIMFIIRNSLSTQGNAYSVLPGDDFFYKTNIKATQVWLEKLWSSKENTSDDSVVNEMLMICPDIAKLRLAVFYNKNTFNAYSKTTAMREADIILSCIWRPFLWSLSKYNATELIAAFSYEAVGGPFTAINHCMLSALRFHPALLDLTNFGMPFIKRSDMHKILEKYEILLKTKWDVEPDFDPFIKEVKYVMCAEACLAIKEIMFVYQGLGCCTQGEEKIAGSVTKMINDFICKGKPMDTNNKNVFFQKTVSTLDRHFIDHHLYRHSATPPLTSDFYMRSFHEIPPLRALLMKPFLSLP